MTERRVGSNLLAMGTAAVLAVYAAGYARTEASAQRVAEGEGHRAPPPAVASAPAPAATVATVDLEPPDPAEPAAAAASAPPIAPAPPAPPAASTSAAPSAGSAANPAPADKAAPAAQPAPAAKPASSAKPASAAPVVVLAKPAPAPALPAFPEADSAVAPPWNDGKFYGWGRSRHGDIRAGVEIVNGRIEQAWIEGCYTRYSCSRIENLIPQVAERQNPEVDNVSGATQSSDAFYYGVIEALGQAKQAK